MSPKYTLRAEPGKFGMDGQNVGGPGKMSAFPLQGDQIVVGVAAMHNMLIAMARALEQSNKTLMQLQASVDPKTSRVDGLPVDMGYLQVLIDENLEILEQIQIDPNAGQIKSMRKEH